MFIVQFIFLFTNVGRVHAAVPTVEIGPNLTQNTTTAGATGSLVSKEFVGDPLATKVAKTFINAFTGSLVNWINSGFEGNPAFVTDFSGFLLDVADQETGHFIEMLGLTDLCSPWSLDIRIALALPTGQFQREFACTLSDIVANMEDFVNGDFSQGGWAGWFELTTRPQNNPYGLYLMTSSALDRRIVGAQRRKSEILNWNNGFFSYEKCEDLPAGVAGPPRCEIVTPGSIIEGQLDRTLGTNLRQLELADELDEVVTALLGQLIQQALGGRNGLRGASDSSYGNQALTSQLSGSQAGVSLENVKRRAVVGLEKNIRDETDYRNVKQSTLSSVIAAENLLFSLQVCYAGKLSGSLSAPNKIIAQQRIDNATSTIATQITPIKTSLENDITLSEQSITSLENKRNEINDATSSEEVSLLVNELVLMRLNGELNTSDIFNAQQQQTAVITQMSSLNTTTNTQIAECQAFPPPPAPTPPSTP